MTLGLTFISKISEDIIGRLAFWHSAQQYLQNVQEFRHRFNPLQSYLCFGEHCVCSIVPVLPGQGLVCSVPGGASSPLPDPGDNRHARRGRGTSYLVPACSYCLMVDEIFYWIKLLYVLLLFSSLWIRSGSDMKFLFRKNAFSVILALLSLLDVLAWLRKIN
jgi:hypothetical protein